MITSLSFISESFDIIEDGSDSCNQQDISLPLGAPGSGHGAGSPSPTHHVAEILHGLSRPSHLRPWVRQSCYLLILSVHFNVLNVFLNF